MRDHIFDVLVGLLARDDGLGLHPCVQALGWVLILPRTRSRRLSK